MTAQLIEPDGTLGLLVTTEYATAYCALHLGWTWTTHEPSSQDEMPKYTEVETWATKMDKGIQDSYWTEVERILVTDYAIAPDQANKSVLHYRQLLFTSKIGDIIYHEYPEETAQGIITGGYIEG